MSISLSVNSTKSPYCATVAVTSGTERLLPDGGVPSVSAVVAAERRANVRQETVCPDRAGIGRGSPNSASPRRGWSVSIRVVE